MIDIKRFSLLFPFDNISCLHNSIFFNFFSKRFSLLIHSRHMFFAAQKKTPKRESDTFREIKRFVRHVVEEISNIGCASL